MKTANEVDELDELPEEVDFTGAVRGHFAGRLHRDTIAIVLEPELQQVFPTSESVNEALRLVMKAGELTKPHAKAS